jgi:hypothetical protein
MTTEEIIIKAEVLTEKYKAKVTPIILKGDADGDTVVGYYKEPVRLAKQRALDAYSNGMQSAGAMLLEACLLKEESDPRIVSEAPENDKYYLGACYAVLKAIEVTVDQYKKK